MGQSCGYAVARLVAPTLARISRDADRNAGLHNDRTCLARGSGRSANAVPGTGATAQRGPEAWKEAMRVPSSERCAALYQASLAAEATLNYANDNRKSCDISVPMLNRWKGTAARRYRLATMLVLAALFDPIQQISSSVEITASLVPFGQFWQFRLPPVTLPRRDDVWNLPARLAPSGWLGPVARRRPGTKGDDISVRHPAAAVIRRFF